MDITSNLWDFFFTQPQEHFRTKSLVLEMPQQRNAAPFTKCVQKSKLSRNGQHLFQIIIKLVIQLQQYKL